MMYVNNEGKPEGRHAKLFLPVAGVVCVLDKVLCTVLDKLPDVASCEVD